MKVLKFGGTSVGTAESILSVKSIVAAAEKPVVVVVSALGGVTDALLEAAARAEAGEPDYRARLDALRTRHLGLVDRLVADKAEKDSLKDRIEALLGRLCDLCRGVFLLRDLSERVRDEIASFGERLSATILASVLDDAVLLDPLRFIKTVQHGGRTELDSELTATLIQGTFQAYAAPGTVALVPGFIATDTESGRITTLGRGGSDYTASLIAAALDAELLEIWTDVDGFMTADPRIIQTSYPIDELSYAEAMELCNFGAKVIYPPSLYPVFRKDIPIRILNTFNPGAPGTLIQREARHGSAPIAGIASIGDTCLLTVSAPSMVDIIGVDSRIFSALAAAGISIFFVCQSSSETGISLGVRSADAERALELLSATFAREIAEGSMHPVALERGLSTVAVVGENMRHKTGVAGKLFSTLGRNGISIIAIAQGETKSNISFVVEQQFTRKALNVIHDSFFLSEYQELNLFVCGVGTVGAKLLEQIAGQSEKLMKERNLKINIVGIARSTKGIFDRAGIDPKNYRDRLENGIPLDIDKLRDEVIGMNIFNSVFVDCTASFEVATLYEAFFNHGISVVAANKVAASSDYGTYHKLKETAMRHGVKFLFETNVGAGLPIINTINDLCNSGDRIEKIEAVLSGTLNFIFNTISADVPFSETVRRAKEEGYSEPDPRIDLSGKDVIRKLVILSREAGYKVNQEDVQAEPFIPKEFFECSLEEFWAKLPSLDAGFEARRKELEARDERWRYVAKMEDGKYTVSLRTVGNHHSFYVLDGSNNIILITTERYHKHPMLIQGYGAGAGVTAAGVFADIMSIANI
jgi:aspartokinase/homoserine dehydrogenase 1